jgi:hypothetical protein
LLNGIIQARNDAVKLPQMNLVMAKPYLLAQDPKMITRTWGCHETGLRTQQPPLFINKNYGAVKIS